MIIAALRAQGRMSITELSSALGIEPKGLYYHVRALVEHGLLEQVAIRKGVRRDEAVYAAVGDRFEIDHVGGGFDEQTAADQLAQALIRQNARAWQTASFSLGINDPKRQALMVETINCTLNPSQMMTLKEKILEVAQWAIGQEPIRDGMMVTITIFGSPVVAKFD
jgi:DNA-binding transcriptional ArsR family regulator